MIRASQSLLQYFYPHLGLPSAVTESYSCPRVEGWNWALPCGACEDTFVFNCDLQSLVSCTTYGIYKSHI